MTTRKSLDQSLARFTRAGGRKRVRDAEGKQWLPDHHANFDRPEDEAYTDITFFRSGYEDSDFSNLTIPRRFINRSSLERVSFVNTDLNQSFMCWNDFIECDFTDADLTCCDMRSTNFRNCRYIRCKLIGADLQRSTFEGCDFTDADLTGATVDDTTTDDIELTEEQHGQIGFYNEIGPQPRGG